MVLGGGGLGLRVWWGGGLKSGPARTPWQTGPGGVSAGGVVPGQGAV